MATKRTNKTSSARGSTSRTMNSRATSARSGAKQPSSRTATKRGSIPRAGARSTTKTRSSASGSGGTSAQAQRTTNHERIRRWVEERGGFPASVSGTGNRGSAGVLRIDYPGYSGQDTLKRISWNEFFKKFDESGLVFLYQNKTKTGKPSRFSKFVAR